MLNSKENTKYNKFVEKYRKTIPERYNQIRLMDYLCSKEVDHLISISNRTDGKSFNYCGFLLKFSIEYGIGFCFIVRHYTLQDSAHELFVEIINTMEDYPIDSFTFLGTAFMIKIYYKEKFIGIITDLNKASDLKYLSQIMKYFPIIIYDEFLALESDYLPDEWDKLKTIYESIDRKGEIPYITYPKIIYLGNAVNFSSPVLASLDIYNILENHKINTCRQYGYIALEMNRNDNANEKRNLRAFKSSNDAMTLGQFKINSHNLADEKLRDKLNKQHNKMYIKLYDNYLLVKFDKNKNTLLKVTTQFEKEYHFNLLMKDNTKNSVFLTENFKSNSSVKRFNNNFYKFDNAFTKNYLFDNGLEILNIEKMKTVYLNKLQTNDNHEKNIILYEDTYIENTKKNLLNKFFQ